MKDIFAEQLFSERTPWLPSIIGFSQVYRIIRNHFIVESHFLHQAWIVQLELLFVCLELFAWF